MPVYPDIDGKTGKQRRKAGKLTWLVSVQVKGVPRYRRRHYGTRTEAIRKEAKVYQSLLGQAGRLQNDKLLDLTLEEFAQCTLSIRN